MNTMVSGLQDASTQAQQIFRNILGAMAEPGRLFQLDKLDGPAGLNSATWQSCLALADLDTNIWIEPAVRTPQALDALRFHTGCRYTEQAEDADFAIASSNLSTPLSTFKQGSDEYPDRSCTLIVQVSDLTRGQRLRLTGPGIQSERTITIADISPDWVAQLQFNRKAFPCGIDLILTSGELLMALPRTTQITLINECASKETTCTSQ
ncbi:MAG: phosphonate C-P lyase system protein PhnH [unclassified Hahellaceae]|nr:phosphonate C-P lyase system protein PhnH [Hahellaceae bacterium]|tara:strand:- start:4736 stop:5359 length:624 start_codon:yes stop_codon:yes gene_type:complete